MMIVDGGGLIVVVLSLLFVFVGVGFIASYRLTEDMTMSPEKASHVLERKRRTLKFWQLKNDGHRCSGHEQGRTTMEYNEATRRKTNLFFLPVSICFYLFLSVSICFYLLLSSATFCYLLLPSATFCYLLLPSASFCYLLLPSATFCYLLLPFFCQDGHWWPIPRLLRYVRHMPMLLCPLSTKKTILCWPFNCWTKTESPIQVRERRREKKEEEEKKRRREEEKKRRYKQRRTKNQQRTKNKDRKIDFFRHLLRLTFHFLFVFVVLFPFP